ncbi:hypothetical protein AVEN_11080-1 [Araneus ventricosus]|uniref:DUF5641 domain-containing protein n=1 Tax=Araneus ventricosus TaxID=182803 RepID=A0A4Y2TW07_ARAVE|nr:hypothetical protein AVEN_11080-1 [Araneus ventricosus]
MQIPACLLKTVMTLSCCATSGTINIDPTPFLLLQKQSVNTTLDRQLTRGSVLLISAHASDVGREIPFNLRFMCPMYFVTKGVKVAATPPGVVWKFGLWHAWKCLIKSFNYRERLMRSFWTRWKNEYLLNLRSAHSSLVKNSSPFKVNDVILIKDDHLSQNVWKLGRIIELLPGRDGKMRACKITNLSKFDVTLDRFASRLAAEFIIFLEFFSLILGVDQLAASRLQLDSRNLPEFL